MSGWESAKYRRLSDELSQAQADATRQLEHAQRRHSHRRPPRFQGDPRVWTWKWLVIPVASVGLLLYGAIEIGPPLAAAGGNGIPGSFVVEVENCDKDGCGWTGNFVASHGRVTLRNVSFQGPHGTLYRGDRLAALDTGDPVNVYARHGSRNWIADLGFIAIGAITFMLWAWLVPYRTRRRRLRWDAFLIPRT